MITGTVVDGDTRSLIVDVNGVGYRLFTTAGALEKELMAKTKSTFWTYLAVRDDALDLYGFSEKGERDMFVVLLGVSGIGPKTALGILNAANPATIRKAVGDEDPAYLHKTAGVSRKHAEKIVLELKDKFIWLEHATGESADPAMAGGVAGYADALDALKALGYSEREARDALKKVPTETDADAGDRVKQALKILGKSK